MARHDRGYLREQRDRWVNKRLRQYKHSRRDWERHWPGAQERFDSRKNYLHKTDPWDCGKSNCGVCRNTWNPETRTERKRTWKATEEVS